MYVYIHIHISIYLYIYTYIYIYIYINTGPWRSNCLVRVVEAAASATRVRITQSPRARPSDQPRVMVGLSGWSAFSGVYLLRI